VECKKKGENIINAINQLWPYLENLSTTSIIYPIVVVETQIAFFAYYQRSLYPLIRLDSGTKAQSFTINLRAFYNGLVPIIAPDYDFTDRYDQRNKLNFTDPSRIISSNNPNRHLVISQSRIWYLSNPKHALSIHEILFYTWKKPIPCQAITPEQAQQIMSESFINPVLFYELNFRKFVVN